jgi:hypothetical protein
VCDEAFSDLICVNKFNSSQAADGSSR